MTRRIAERELLRSRRRRRRVSRSGLLGLLGLLRGLLRRLALLGGLLPGGIGGGGLRLLGGDGAERDENNSGKSSGDRADHRETPEACAGRIPSAIGRTVEQGACPKNRGESPRRHGLPHCDNGAMVWPRMPHRGGRFSAAVQNSPVHTHRECFSTGAASCTSRRAGYNPITHKNAAGHRRRGGARTGARRGQPPPLRRSSMDLLSPMTSRLSPAFRTRDPGTRSTTPLSRRRTATMVTPKRASTSPTSTGLPIQAAGTAISSTRFPGGSSR